MTARPGAGLRTERGADGVLVVTLDRPDRLNAIDLATADALRETWRRLRGDGSVRAAVLSGAGGRAFCTGIDRSASVPQPSSPYSLDDPLADIGPKANGLWKPVVAAVDGMACGGAFYLLAESDFTVASEPSSFFDPHTGYGMVSAYESILMAQRAPVGEIARMALMGAAERMSAARAHAIGLVSEVVPAGEAVVAAVRSAAVIASYPTEAVQGTVRAVWAAHEAARAQALAHAPHLIALGNLPQERQEGLFAARGREHRVR